MPNPQLSDFKKFDISGYPLREVNRQTALSLSFDYAVFFKVPGDDSIYIYTWLTFNARGKVHFPEFEILHYYVDARYVTDDIIEEYKQI
jgi:hypothetical protein